MMHESDMPLEGTVHEELGVTGPFTVELTYKRVKGVMAHRDEARLVYVRVSPVVQLSESLVEAHGEYVASLYGATASSVCYVFRLKREAEETTSYIKMEHFHKLLRDIFSQLAAIDGGGERLLGLVE